MYFCRPTCNVTMQQETNTMTRIDILGLLTELLEEEVSLEQIEEADEALKAYSEILASDDEEEAELDEIIPDLVQQLRDKRKSLIRAKEEAQQKIHLKEAEAVIEKLRLLIQDEENIGRAFSTFNQIRDEWNAIGSVPRDQYARVQTEYSRLQESFYYTINIYKELADHDKRINLKKKEDLVGQVEHLDREPNIQVADTKLRELIKKWDDIGATFPEDWERVKNSFWAGARKIMSKVDEHYEGIRAKQSEHLEQKKLLIKQVQDISEKPREKRKEWNDATEKVLGIQAAWKKIGFSKENESVWQEFRSACDTFFDAKQAFYDKMGAVYDERKAKKEALITKAAQLAESQDWKNTAAALQDLQKQWKEIGAASQRDENKLWKQFRSHCDSFFNARNANFKSRDKEEKANLAVKEDIIARLQALELTGNKGSDIQTLRNFSDEWKDAGHVPFKVKDKIYKTYKEALDKHYSALKLDQQEKRKVAIENKVAAIKNDPSSANREKSHIRRQIDAIIRENRQYENNLGFINDRKGTNPLIKEVERKIRRNQDRIKELKETLRLLNTAGS